MSQDTEKGIPAFLNTLLMDHWEYYPGWLLPSNLLSVGCSNNNLNSTRIRSRVSWLVFSCNDLNSTCKKGRANFRVLNCNDLNITCTLSRSDWPLWSMMASLYQATLAAGRESVTRHSSCRGSPALTSTSSPSPTPTTLMLVGDTVEDQKTLLANYQLLSTRNAKHKFR